jgi:hypothetical protein
MGKHVRKIVSVIDAPAISLDESEQAWEVLLKFYRALGWNGLDDVEPCKVRTTRAVYLHLYDLICEKCPDKETVGMTMVNIGPGVDEDIPPNKVYLLEGWIIESKGDDYS